MIRIAYAVIVVGLVACGKVNDDKPVDASNIDSPAPECAVGTTAICEDNQLTLCDGNGNITSTSSCSLGCNTAEPRCNKLDPSNGLAAFLDEAEQAPDLTFTGATVIDTDAGTITDTTGPLTPPTSTLTAGLPVGVFVIKAKTLTTGNVQIVGSRALAIVASNTITINGRFSANARLDASGPGAILNDGTCRGGNGSSNANGSSGGGGGGFGSVGAAGGRGGVPSVLGGTAGATSGTIELVPLRGGCPGGNAGGRSLDVDPVASDPGGAGGAVQLVSSAGIVIGDAAFLSANGGGGKGNNNLQFCAADLPCGDGEGAGSGGGILLEAPSITVAATGGVVANGGAGSCAVSGTAPGGQNTAVPAVGQVCGGDTGNGGDGAAGGIAAKPGTNGLNDDPVGGGGGAGAGRIRVNVPLGSTFTPAGVVSPTSTVGNLAVR